MDVEIDKIVESDLKLKNLAVRQLYYEKGDSLFNSITFFLLELSMFSNEVQKKETYEWIRSLFFNWKMFLEHKYDFYAKDVSIRARKDLYLGKRSISDISIEVIGEFYGDEKFETEHWRRYQNLIENKHLPSLIEVSYSKPQKSNATQGYSYSLS